MEELASFLANERKEGKFYAGNKKFNLMNEWILLVLSVKLKIIIRTETINSDIPFYC